ncbi:hypothetical protein [Ramlibacter sp. AN1133]|uniref:hypothetical protein n=1 Tax=Ramlibacter sp. AN1133 TaxID=3133429 RepID=UPI0030BF6347
MKFVRTVLVVLGSCCLAAAAQAQELYFGHLAMQWPGGYTVVRPAEPVLLRGPQAQEVAASVYLASADEPPDPNFADRSVRLVRSAAASHGRVVRTTRSVLPDGSTLVAAASQARGAARGYLLQFTVLAAAGHVGYVTVQGRGGDAAVEFRRLLPAFQSVRWVDMAGGVIIAHE